MATPRSVRYINKYPSANSRFSLGTKLYEIIEFLRELHDSFSASGALLTLANELRTRLHTAGDYQVLISAIRAELISGGQLADRLIDLEDKAYNMCITDPGWQEDAVQTQFECANAINAVVDGVYIAGAVAATTTHAPTSPAWDTGAGETRIVTLSTTGVASNITATVSAVDATIPPRPPSGQCPIGIVNIPANFTGGVTQIAAGGVTFVDGFPRRLDVHTPIATANVAAIVASALTATALDKVDSLPDRG